MSEALSSVTTEDIGRILTIPVTKKMDLKQSCRQENAATYRESLIDHFVKMSPYASWEWLGGRLLYWEMGPALEQVKKHIEVWRGEHQGSLFGKGSFIFGWGKCESLYSTSNLL